MHFAARSLFPTRDRKHGRNSIQTTLGLLQSHCNFFHPHLFEVFFCYLGRDSPGEYDYLIGLMLCIHVPSRICYVELSRYGKCQTLGILHIPVFILLYSNI